MGRAWKEKKEEDFICTVLKSHWHFHDKDMTKLQTVVGEGSYN